MTTFEVTWTETNTYSEFIEAESEDDAIETMRYNAKRGEYEPLDWHINDDSINILEDD